METSFIRHSSAIAANVANSTAFRFNTGSAPGIPRHTGHTFVLGGSPKRVEQEQKIFEAVSSWTWTSSPMTTSYFAIKAAETAEAVLISGIINSGQMERRASPSGHYLFLHHFSSGISKYITSLPPASCTPIK